MPRMETQEVWLDLQQKKALEAKLGRPLPAKKDGRMFKVTIPAPANRAEMNALKALLTSLNITAR